MLYDTLLLQILGIWFQLRVYGVNTPTQNIQDVTFRNFKKQGEDGYFTTRTWRYLYINYLNYFN